MGFIRNPRAVLLLAACRMPKSDRLLVRLRPFVKPRLRKRGSAMRRETRTLLEPLVVRSKPGIGGPLYR